MLRLVVINLLVLLVLLAGMEAALVWLVHGGGAGSWTLDRLARKIYWANVSFVQFEPDCAQYDAGLGYTLRPGTCRFASPAFDTTLEINSAGLRDDEASLTAPSVIVLGDSQAMGWGVEQDETFAALVEAETGERVLNAGVSSYGTARELGLLARLDRSNLQTLILQYSDNDAWENRQHLAGGSALSTMDEATYAEAVEENTGGSYVFGSYLVSAVLEFLPKIGGERDEGDEGTPQAAPDMSEAEVLLALLEELPVDQSQTSLIVMEVNVGGRRGGYFMKVFSELPELEAVRQRYRGFAILEVDQLLGPGDYIYPDGHMNGTGHRKLAERLSAMVAANRAIAH